MTVDTTVLTPSTPDRASLLADAIASVQAQTIQPYAHLIRIQPPPADTPTPITVARQRNRLLAAVDTKWCSILDDDDTYHPNHFHAIHDALDTDVDVIYTYADQPCVARVNVTDWTQRRLIHRLKQANDCVPYNATIRTAALRAIGGWDETTYTNGAYATGANWDDWDLWLRLAQHDARFVCVPTVTWDYRSGDWKQSSR
jgi:hypothetical protein